MAKVAAKIYSLRDFGLYAYLFSQNCRFFFSSTIKFCQFSSMVETKPDLKPWIRSLILLKILNLKWPRKKFGMGSISWQKRSQRGSSMKCFRNISSICTIKVLMNFSIVKPLLSSETLASVDLSVAVSLSFDSDPLKSA